MRRQMHMLQHRAHADAQVERIRLDTLLREHGVLVRVLGKAQTRTTRLLTEKSSELEKLTTQVMQARAESIGKDSVTAFLQADLEALRTRVPDLESRSRLREQINHLSQRNASLVAQMAELQGKLARQNKERVASEARESDVEPQVPCVTHPVTLHLKQRNILCVGGRGGNVATYRELIERVGRRFSHHDGGLEDSPSLLGVRLAAADIVICQTGCISHNAYRRVKDFCKRTDKRCVFVENPSTASLVRGLEQVGDAAEAETETKFVGLMP